MTTRVERRWQTVTDRRTDCRALVHPWFTVLHPRASHSSNRLSASLSRDSHDPEVLDSKEPNTCLETTSAARTRNWCVDLGIRARVFSCCGMPMYGMMSAVGRLGGWLAARCVEKRQKARVDNVPSRWDK
jgi:hypothetical protein